MNRLAELLAIAAVAMAAANAVPAHAQGAKQTVGLAQINPATLASGYRSSKVVFQSSHPPVHCTDSSKDRGVQK